MAGPFGGSSTSKAQGAADALNRFLYNLVLSCVSGAAQLYDYWDVGVVGYGEGVGSAFQGVLEQPNGAELVSIAKIQDRPLRIEERDRPDGTGGVVKFKMPIWIDPMAGGRSPMGEAFQRAYAVLKPWTRTNPTSFPPVVINIAEGEPDDMDEARHQASRLLSVGTSDGPVLVFNFHISSGAGAPISFPSAPDALPDGLARFLFDISSILPPSKVRFAADRGIALGEGARGFVYNGGVSDLPTFLDIGSRGVAIASALF
jgi:hypothetical protein